MVNYQKGKIYAIRSYTTDMVYIGSTTQPLSRRLSKHRSNYKRFLAGKYNNVTSFELIKHGDAYIELVEDYPCDRKDQLLKREGELIRETNCINRYVAGRSDKENKDHKKAYNKAYRDAHKAYDKTYYDTHKD